MRRTPFGGDGGSSASVQFHADTGRDFQTVKRVLRALLRVVHDELFVRSLWEMIQVPRLCGYGCPDVCATSHLSDQGMWVSAQASMPSSARPTMSGLGASGDTPFKPTDETRGIVADAALALVETQLLAQVTEDANLDGRTTGLLGFSAALAAVTVAAKEAIGFLWPVPLGVLGAVTFVFLWILYGGSELRHILRDLLHPPNRVGFGVPAWAFYEKFIGTSPLKARERLLEELAEEVKENTTRISQQQRRLQAATFLMVAGLLVAGLLIAFDRPTKMKTCSGKSPQCHSRPAPQDSKKSAPVAPSSETNGELLRLAVEIERGHNGPLVEVAASIEG